MGKTTIVCIIENYLTVFKCHTADHTVTDCETMYISPLLTAIDFCLLLLHKEKIDTGDRTAPITPQQNPLY